MNTGQTRLIMLTHRVFSLILVRETASNLLYVRYLYAAVNSHFGCYLHYIIFQIQKN